ncbi:MAG: 50S ribosomal protein L24 [Myxococcota bacterium]|jgi:large subunit ribosomal protein L24|nr:50S ribosomal protein L24 [Myxococcota bacterium]
MNRLRKGDSVKIISGKDRGKEGKILGFTHGGDRVLVEGLNIVKRHSRPTQASPQGGIVEKEAGIHASNVMPLTEEGRSTRVGYRMNDEGEKVRYSKRFDEDLD